MDTLKKYGSLLLIAFLPVFICICCSVQKTLISPPIAEKVKKTSLINDCIITDDYFWLREKENPDVIKYLETENIYTQEMMKQTEPLQDKLYNEMISRLKEDDTTVPAKKDDYFYYYRTEKNKDYSIFCRKYQSLDSEEEILLDLNEYADQHEYLELGTTLLSPDHTLLAYTLDTDGSEAYTLFIKDLESNELLDDVIKNADDIAWGSNNELIFYSTVNDTQRSDRIYLHSVGQSPETDKLVFYEENDSFYVSISKTRSEKYLLLSSSSNTTSEYYYLDSNDPFGDFQLIAQRRKDIYYSVDHINESFYILTNENAKYRKIMKTNEKNLCSHKDWAEYIPHDRRIMIEGIILFSDHIVLQILEDSLRKFRVIDAETGEEHYIEFPEEVYSVFAGDNWEADTDTFRFEYTSFISPDSVYDHNMNLNQNTLLKQEEILGGYDKELYETERIWAESMDDPDIKIPVSLVYKRDMFARDGSSPLLLYSYGSYGSISDVEFSSEYISLIDRGLIYAIAHIRGGGELGTDWYEDGRLLKRKNTFNDLIASARYLIRQKYSSRGNIIIHGISAGGQVVGAVANISPELFCAVIAEVPFVDVLNTMLDADLPLTVAEYEEWGNPNDRKYFNYIKSYCPYQNIRRQDYPDMLITAGYNDPRVGYWEPAKFTAKLRDLKTDDNIILLKTNMGSGHFGSTGRYGWYRDLAFQFAYILDRFGINE